ncbi:MAG: ion transporter [Oligoflexus sp.]
MLPMKSSNRQILSQFLENPIIQGIIFTLIVFNAVILGLETIPQMMAQYGSILAAIDGFILWIFVIELALALLADGWRFFTKPWRIFDSLVVGIAFVPSMGPLAVLRSLRILRALRLISVSPRLRSVVTALLAAIPGLSSIFVILFLIFYVFGVAATQLFGSSFPDWFGNLGRSMYTLFQVMTLESWSMGIVRPILDEYPYAWLFFIPFICIATFTMLNLFIAVIVNAMQGEHEITRQEEKQNLDLASSSISQEIHEEMIALRQEIRDMKAALVK